MFRIQQDLNLSNKKTIVLAQDLRLATGSREAVELGFQENLVIHSHVLDDLLDEIQISYVRVDKDTKVREHFSRPKLYAMITRVSWLGIERKVTLAGFNTILIKIGINGDGVFLKFCMSIFDINNLVFRIESGLSKKFKDSGVITTFLIAAIPDVPDN